MIYSRYPGPSRNFTNTFISTPLRAEEEKWNYDPEGATGKRTRAVCPESKAVFLNSGHASESAGVPFRSGDFWAPSSSERTKESVELAWRQGDSEASPET